MRKKAFTEDIGKLFTLLDENNVTSLKFVALSFRKVLPVDSGAIYLCFLMKSVTEIKKIIESLLVLNQQVSDLRK